MAASRFQELYFRAATELWVAAVHNDELRAVLGPAERRLNNATSATSPTGR